MPDRTDFSAETGMIRPLTMTDINDVLRLQQTVVTHLPDKDLFHPDSADFFSRHMRESPAQRGVMYGCFVHDDLIAYCTLSYPGTEADNIGFDLGWDRETCNTVAHLDTVAVHPDYRGNGLQRRFSRIMIARARADGYRRLCATVSPENIPSLNNCLQHGMKIERLVTRYQGKQRYLLVKWL